MSISTITTSMAQPDLAELRTDQSEVSVQPDPARMTLDELGIDIRHKHAHIVEAISSALDHARDAGRLLLEAKKRIPHGQFLTFVQDTCGLHVRTAQDYMAIASHWSAIEPNAQRVAHLSIRAALALIRTPADDAPRERPVPVQFWNDCPPDVQRELRRITAELDEFPFVPHTFVPRPDRSECDVVPGGPGAPVYWDIVGGDPTSGRPYFNYTRSVVAQKLHAFIGGGPRSVVSDLAIDVARRRVLRDRALAPPMLPIDPTVTLNDDRFAKCERLKEGFGTTSLDDTVGAAIDYADWAFAVDRLSAEEAADQSAIAPMQDVQQIDATQAAITEVLQN
jgi:hypothetical protein